MRLGVILLALIVSGCVTGQESASISSVSPPTCTNSTRILMSGQSNALGTARGGPAWSTVDPRVTVWNSGNPMGSAGSSFVPASVAASGGTFYTLTDGNAGVWFADRLARETGKDVCLTLAARSGYSITRWTTSDDGAALMLDRIGELYGASNQPPADIFLWQQGESDYLDGMSPAQYHAYFAEMLSLLKARGAINDRTVIIVGGMYEGSPATIAYNANALKALSALHGNVAYADAKGLKSPDKMHFDGPSLNSLGKTRYWMAYQSLIPKPSS